MRRLALVVAVAVGCVLLGLHAQGQQPQNAFRAGVDVVQLDVSVLDRDRRPVKNLTAADFTVFENGKPQPVVAFGAVNLPEPVEPSARWIREAARDVVTNDRAERRIVVIVLDDANLPADAMVSTTAAQVARAVVDHLGDEDLASVTFTDSGRRQNVTADRELLRTAIDSTAPHPQSSGSMNALSNALHSGPLAASPVARSQRLTGGGAPGPCAYRGPYHTPYACVVDTLVNAANALLAAPVGRKTLVFISPGVPFDFSMSELRGWQNPGDDVLALQSMLKALQQANVNVYAIDPSGVIAGIMGPRQDSLRVLAEENGGRATLATNAPWDAVPQIFRENSSYYLIGFRSTNPTKDGGFRRVQVKVDRPGLEVRARSGYFAPEPVKAKSPRNTPPPVAPLDKAMGDVVAGGDLPLALSVAPFALPGQSKAALAIAIAFREPQRPGTQRVELVATAINDDCIDCDPSPNRRDTIEFQLPPATPLTTGYGAMSRLTVRPGRYNVRVAARIDDRFGNVFTDIDVPRFDKDRLSVSGLVLSAADASLTAQRTLLADVVPIVPTALREFGSTAKVTAFMRVYQGGLKPPGAVRVRATIVDDTDRTKLDEATVIEGSGFSRARAADYRLELPLTRLETGPHLLTIEAQLGDTVMRRQARINVK